MSNEEFMRELNRFRELIKDLPYTLYGSEKTIDWVKQLENLPNNVKLQSHPSFEDGTVYLIATPVDKPLKIYCPDKLLGTEYFN